MQFSTGIKRQEPGEIFFPPLTGENIWSICHFKTCQVSRKVQSVFPPVSRMRVLDQRTIYYPLLCSPLLHKTGKIKPQCHGQARQIKIPDNCVIVTPCKISIATNTSPHLPHVVINWHHLRILPTISQVRVVPGQDLLFTFLFNVVSSDKSVSQSVADGKSKILINIY